MKKWVFLCVTLSASFPVNEVLARNCKLGIPKPKVIIDVDYGQVKYNNGHSALQIGAKFGQHRRPGWDTVGKTRSKLHHSLEFEYSYLPVKRNRYCVGLSSVRYKIGYETFRVYIARKYKPGSCRYRVTLDHENTHVHIQQSTLRKYLPTIEARLKAAAAKMEKILVSNPESAGRSFKAKLNASINPTLSKMENEMKSKNARIDTTDNYLREQKLCPSDR